MFTNESLLVPKELFANNNDFDRMLRRYPSETQAILSRIACEVSNSFTLINSQIQLMNAHHPQLQTSEQWNQLSLDTKDISNFLHDFSTYIHSEQLHNDEANIAELFSETVNQYADKAALKDIDLSLLIGEPLSICITNYLCDSEKIKLALNNVVNWLIDITDNSKSIHIKLPSTKKDYYEHTNGIRYMKIQLKADASTTYPDVQDAVYQPPSDTKCVSTNLSMSIAHRIIYAHKGGMSLDCTDKHITVSIFLPV